MSEVKFLIILGLIGSLFVSGCSSFCRVISDPEPGSDTTLRSPAGTFYIADLKLKSNAASPQAAEKEQQYQQKFLPMLRKECRERYPALFSETSAGSIPLLVEAETLKFSLAPIKIRGLMYTYDSEEELCVKVSAWTGRKDMRGEIIQRTARREEHARKKTELNVDVQAIEDSELRKRAPQIATVIAGLVAGKDPAFWIAQPHWIEFSGSQPVPPAGASGTLLPPVSTAAPF
jgi:hypothetical protein